MSVFFKGSSRNFGAAALWRVAVPVTLACAACTSPPAPAPAAQQSSVPQPHPPQLGKSKPPAPKVEAPEPPKELPPKLARPWSYVLPVDHGVRSDSGGQGGFLAPRYHGKHNGLDLLAPIGTATLSPCDGKARQGKSRSFGNWVQVVCPIPSEVSGGSDLFASIFYSHLDSTKLRGDKIRSIRRGQQVGAVGKSGNASGDSIAPHLHLEVVLHDSEDAAFGERHSGRDQSNTKAADVFLRELSEQCMLPNHFARNSGEPRRARRADPFVVLTCLSEDKPEFAAPKGKLEGSSDPWSAHYVAQAFDVDRGRRASR